VLDKFNRKSVLPISWDDKASKPYRGLLPLYGSGLLKTGDNHDEKISIKKNPPKRLSPRR
jgi:hypothetical protein